MIEKINNGGPAFPWPVPTFDSQGKMIGHSTEQCGMTLRDWFAGMAMLGRIANPRLVKVRQGVKLTKYQRRVSSAGVAAKAYVLADAMIAEREKVGAK